MWFVKVEFDHPYQGIGAERTYLSWWHVPVWLASKFMDLPDCRVFLKLTNGDERRLVWPTDAGPVELRTLVFGDEPINVPVVVRSERPTGITAGLLTLPHFPLPAGVVRITDVQAIYHRQNFLDLAPGEHELRLVVKYRQFEFPSPVYRLRVPSPTVGNGHFTLIRTEDS